jgi:hemolysin activation/secretion protein
MHGWLGRRPAGLRGHWGMSNKRSSLPICALIASLFVVLCAPASAQLPTPQELNPAARVPAPAKPSGNGDLLSPPEPGPCPLASSNLKFTLTDVTFTGAATVSHDELAEAYAGLVGHEVPVSVLCEIRDRASTILFGKGLFARVEIPAQRISEGHVTFDVIEAYIASVRVQGDDSGAQAKVEDYIEMLRGMRPFNIRTAQRYLYLASDVPGISMAATLRPAGKGRGAIELVITVARKPVGAIVNVQNFGSQATGPYGALARVDLNGFTPLGERTTVVGYQTFDLKEQRVFQLIEEARFGSDGLLARVSGSFGETHPGDQLKTGQFFGQAYVADASLSYPIVRLRAENLTLTAGMEAVDQKITSLRTPPPLSQDRLRVFYLRANGDISWRGEVPFKLDGDVELRKGVAILGASRKKDPFLSRVEGDPEAFVLRGDARATAGLLEGVTGIVRVQGQYTGVPLLSYEEQSIGNLTIGRGYDPSALSGDRAVAASADLRWDPLPSDWPVTASGFGFFDIGRAWSLESSGGVNKTVKSVGGGLTFQILSRFHVETTYAHPLDKVNNKDARRPPDRILVSATVEY